MLAQEKALQGILGLLANSSDGACLLDAKQRILFWNREAQRILGFRAEETEGRPCWEVLQCTELKGTSVCGPGCSIVVCLQRGRAAPNRRYLATCRDGSHITLECSTAAFALAEREGCAGVLFFRPALMPQSAAAAHPTLWDFHCLGGFEIRKDGLPLPVTAFHRRQALTLLRILLTCRGKPLHRETLMELLWPEVGAREGLLRLKVLVHSLRSTLEPSTSRDAPARLLLTGDESYFLSAEADLWVDVDAYRDLAAQGEAAYNAGRLAESLEHFNRACALYKGEYLPEDRYEDWSNAERNALHQTQQQLLMKAAGAAELLGSPQTAVDYYQQALALDPCREDIYRLLMTALWKQGRRDEAARQFHRCASALIKEVGVSPEPETVNLYSAIFGDAPPRSSQFPQRLAAV